MSTSIKPLPLDRTEFPRLEAIGRFVALGGAAAAALPRSLTRPGLLLEQTAQMTLGALPLALAAGVSIGLVSWLQARLMLGDYELEAQLPGVVAAFVVIGVGPVLAALVAAGQWGARLAAELGAMKTTEQLDALAAMGVDPVATLVPPRVAGAMLALPMLTILLDYTALAAAGGAEWLWGTQSLGEFGRGLLMFLRLDRAIAATLAAVPFGMLIGLAGCWSGLECGDGADQVGRASRRGVVLSMLLTLIANVLWVRVVQLVLR